MGGGLSRPTKGTDAIMTHPTANAHPATHNGASPAASSVAAGVSNGVDPTRRAANRLFLALGLFQVLTGIAILLVPHRLAQHLFEHWVSEPWLTGPALVV